MTRSITRLLQSTLAAAVLAGAGAPLAVAADDNVPTDTKPDRKADADESARARAVQFLRDHVLNVQLAEPVETVTLKPGKLAAETKVTRKVTNLVKFPHGFQFDLVQQRQQTNYDLGPNGERTGQPRVKDSLYVIRHRVSERRSTGALIGIADSHYSDLTKYPYSPSALKIRVEDDALVLEQETIHYQDLYGEGGTWTPGKIRIEYTFRVKDGQLRLKTVERGYDLDQETGEFVARENNLVSTSHPADGDE